MMGMAGRRGGRSYHDPRDSVLGHTAGVVYWYLALTVLLALASSPGLVALMLLDRVPANVSLAVLCLLPIGPALAAALFALRERIVADEPVPARTFWRGYRLNVAEILRLWVPTLVVLAVIAVSLTNLDAAGVPDGYGAVLVVIGGLVVLWSLNALIITSLFTFRARDTARLAAHYLVRMPLVTLGTVSLLILAAAVVYATFDAVLLLLGAAWAALLLRNARPIIDDVRAHFTR